jgi:endonuclease G
MDELEKRLARLRTFNASVQSDDPTLATEARSVMPSTGGLERMTSTAGEIGLESIILKRTRPVLNIRQNDTELVFADQADSVIWKERLTRAKPLLDRAIRAVGRIELSGGDLDWVGTGWLVAEDILVTNRHVASEFASRDGEGFDFKLGDAGKIAAGIDFLQEVENDDTLVFRLARVLHIEDAPGPDVAFFEVERLSNSRTLAEPIELSDTPIATQNAATIGYPAFDSRIPDPDLMEKIYGRIYNKKRLAPGAVTRIQDQHLLHNCTTLGGNSGSAVLDLDSGRALGLHFSGTFLTSNYAVRADLVKQILADIRSGRRRAPIEAKPPKPAEPPAATVRMPATRPAQQDGRSVTFNIPLTVTVTLGEPTIGALAVSQRLSASAGGDTGDEAGGDVAGSEGVVADYRDREGYDPKFLGDGQSFTVELPEVKRDADDVLDFKLDGEAETELRYEHYSVVMSRSRRMCFFSACNIDGSQSKKAKRVQWKWDPRIPKQQQIMNECYGNPPKFSRGHMTRREDPGWGTPVTAKRGNEDSMHVTNATPQMQAFNAPIWLALEDYALDHTKEDGMKVSVFTGPYFHDRDPEMHGVVIPRAFWKVIAFIHDDTGKLCATGYEMNQEQNLKPAEEFVFGAFTSPQLNVAAQVPIRSIERRSGLSFGRLASVDPLSTQEGLGDAAQRPLVSLEQIRFVA